MSEAPKPAIVAWRSTPSRIASRNRILLRRKKAILSSWRELKGDTSIQEAARKHGLKVAEIEEWKGRYLLAAENALRSRPRDDEALREEHVKKLERKVGQLVVETDVLKAALKIARPLGSETSEE